MYAPVVILLTIVGPLVCIALVHQLGSQASWAMLTVQWFAFWAAGLRLLLAGVRQILDPSFTSRTILGINDDRSVILVREVGFGNLAVGSLGVLSLWISSWQSPAAFAGGVFFVLAGINHLCQSRRSSKETLAMVTDLFAAFGLWAGWITLLVSGPA